MTPFQIRITEEDNISFKKELFLDGAFCVISHSGLNPVERVGLARLSSLPASPHALLIAGNRTGVTAMVMRKLFPECAVTCHAFDLHHARAMANNLSRNGVPVDFRHDAFVQTYDTESLSSSSGEGAAVTVACTTEIPDAPSDTHLYDAAVFMYTPGMMTGELQLDQLEDIHRHLAPQGKLLMTAETPPDPLFRQLKAIFGNYQVLAPGSKKRPVCILAEKREELENPREFLATFTASVPGHDPLSLLSLPGVFCHRRPDTGGLALAEVAVRELEKEPLPEGGIRNLLDMGCGCGLVGLLIASAVPVTRTVFVDSHARALESTRRNAESLGIHNAVYILSDNGAPQRGYDVFVGNPPYYSEYRIADVFLDTAFQSLHRGGICLTVAKTAEALSRRQEEFFGNIEAIPRRNYSVLRSIR